LEQAKFGMASANIQSEIQRRADQTRLEGEKPPKQAPGHYFVDDQGKATYAGAQTPTVATPVIGAQGPTKPPKVAVGKSPKEPSMQERAAAGDYHVALSDHTALVRLEANPGTMQEVAKFMAIPAFGKLVPWGLSGGVTELIRKARTAGLSASAQEYLKRLYDYASLVGPTRYGRQFRNEVLLEQVWSDFGAGQLGITPQGIQATQSNRLNGVRALQAKAGTKALEAVAPVFPTDTTPPAPTGGINKRFDPRQP